MAWMQAHRLHGSLHRFHHARVSWGHRFSGSRKLKQRVDKIGHLVYTGPNLLIELLPLRGRQAAVTKKLRISHNRRQRVTKIMRNRTRHASNGRQLLRLQQRLLGLKQTGAHAVERRRKFRYLVAAPGVKRMVKVAMLQSADGVHQVGQRTWERLEN